MKHFLLFYFGIYNYGIKINKTKENSLTLNYKYHSKVEIYYGILLII